MPQKTAPLAIDPRHLVKRHRNNAVVNSLSLQIRVGEVFGILCPRGAGKTATVEMIAGLRKPTTGHVRILGRGSFGNEAKVRQVELRMGL